MSFQKITLITVGIILCLCMAVLPASASFQNVSTQGTHIQDSSTAYIGAVTNTQYFMDLLKGNSKLDDSVYLEAKEHLLKAQQVLLNAGADSSNLPDPQAPGTQDRTRRGTARYFLGMPDHLLVTTVIHHPIGQCFGERHQYGYTIRIQDGSHQAYQTRTVEEAAAQVRTLIQTGVCGIQ